MYVQEGKTPLEAAKFCRKAFGSKTIGKLFEPQNKNENILVLSKAEEIGFTTARNFIYIGLKKEPYTNRILYSSTAEEVTFTDFATPDEQTDPDENIIVVTQDTKKWYTAQKNYENRRRPSICEMVKF